MKYCSSCGTPLDDKDVFCWKCGSRQPEPEIKAATEPNATGDGFLSENHQFCEECGAKLYAGDSFCTECGTRIESSFDTPNKQLSKSDHACKQCGMLLEEGDFFCTECGAEIESNDQFAAIGKQEVSVARHGSSKFISTIFKAAAIIAIVVLGALIGLHFVRPIDKKVITTSVEATPADELELKSEHEGPVEGPAEGPVKGPVEGPTEPTLPSFNAAACAEIGKSLVILRQQNPGMTLNTQMPGVYGNMAQLLGSAENGTITYYFYQTSELPLIDNLAKSGYEEQLLCAGIYTTVGELFPQTTEDTAATDFFQSIEVEDYSYTYNVVIEPGVVEFTYNGYTILVDYRREITAGAASSDVLPPQFIKNSYPAYLIDTGIEEKNYALCDMWRGQQQFEELVPPEFVPYTIQVKSVCLRIYDEPSFYANVVGEITDNSIYTIVEESFDQGSMTFWGKLKSGVGWINLAAAEDPGIVDYIDGYGYFHYQD